MLITSRTFEGPAKQCLVCGAQVDSRPAQLPGTAPCPKCGTLLWFSAGHPGGQPDLVLPSLTLDIPAQSSKHEVVARVVHQLVALGLIRPEHEGEVVAGILKREAVATTGIGEGIALPHTKHPRLERSVGAIVRLAGSVSFDSIDGKPVHTLGVVVSPISKPQEHLRMLAAVCKDLGGL